MIKLLPWLKNHKTTVLLISILGIIGILGVIGIGKITAKPEVPVEEIDLAFDPEGPYALLFPRRDGNALVLNLKRTGSYDGITYELAYTSNVDETIVTGNKISVNGDEEAQTGSIDRGVVGTIDTKEGKSEYEQEILFGTCSKNVCKYDKGVENGTLTLHIKKGREAYKMVTQWHLQKPDVALGSLSSGDGHLIYKVDGDRQALSNTGYSIINDLTGVPKLPSGKSVVGKVYSLNVPVAKEVNKGLVSLELAENPTTDTKIYRYNSGKSEWQELDTKAEGSKLSAQADGGGIFAVFKRN